MKKLHEDVYLNNPELSSYFSTLPPLIKQRLLESGVEISTLGELKQCAAHFING